MRKLIIVVSIFLSVFLPIYNTHSAELIQETHDIVRAQVTQIKSSTEKNVEGANIATKEQVISIKILEGVDTNKNIELINDYIQLKDNQKFFLNRIEKDTGDVVYSVADTNRLPILGGLFALFLLVVFFVGGKQGIRGLLSFALSIFCIVFLLLPGIMKGYSPLWVSFGVSGLIIIIGSYITHGFNRTTTSAVIGMLGTVLFTGILAYVAVEWSSFTGMTSDESLYLNINTQGVLDFTGLLLGGIMIGLLGVLYDSAIGQAVFVEELYRSNKDISEKTVFKKALRVGKEHIGALVDTLAIAYVGASLPLFLLLQTTENFNLFVLNREMFAAEIVRILVGSIGLILAVPATTLVSVFFLKKYRGQEIHGHETHHHHHSH